MTEKAVQVYLMNAKSILDYGAQPNFTIDISDRVDPFWTKTQGYLHIGEFGAKFPEIPKREELIVKTVEGLREQIHKTLAEAEVKCQELETEIGDLLMLGHSPKEVHPSADTI